MDQFEKLFSFDKIYTKGQLNLPTVQIFQVGELSLIPGGVIKLHEQYCDEITYVISGKGTVITDQGREKKIASGGVHFLRHGGVHEIRVDRDQSFRYICIGFLCNDIDEDMNQIIAELYKRNDFIVQDPGEIRILCELLMNEMYFEQQFRNNMIEAYCRQLLVHIYRCLTQQKTERAKPTGHGDFTGITIYHILRYIDRNILNITNIREIAEALSYSEYYVVHLFKEKMGCTIMDYIRKKKVAMAVDMLKEKNASVSKIAEQLNFKSHRSFSRTFKEIVGETPKAYRNRHQ